MCSLCRCAILTTAEEEKEEEGAGARETLPRVPPSEAPEALQASECSDLPDPLEASCWISAQR